MSHIWMEHAEHGGRAQLPDIPYWRARGWEPCDGPPPEPDLTRDPEPSEPPVPPGVLAVQEDAEPAQPEPTSEEKE